MLLLGNSLFSLRIQNNYYWWTPLAGHFHERTLSVSRTRDAPLVWYYKITPYIQICSDQRSAECFFQCGNIFLEDNIQMMRGCLLKTEMCFIYKFPFFINVHRPFLNILWCYKQSYGLFQALRVKYFCQIHAYADRLNIDLRDEE